ncbi:MAG TPA: RraA family protein [Anaerolineaceae bacterium]|nr:RraA family protein [Anaerolineaceae bacterium]
MAKYDKSVIEAFRKITTASVADALWELGVSGHMGHEMKPIFPAKIVGPAVTVREEPTVERLPPNHALELIDQADIGSVIVIAIDGVKDVAVWGGLMTAGAVANQLEGAVLDGGCRDVEEILRDFQFPVFSRSIVPATTVGRYRTIAANEPVEVGGVTVNPGDLVVGDSDGVVVVPAERVDEVLQKAIDIEEREKAQTRLIRETGSLLKGLEKYNRI